MNRDKIIILVLALLLTVSVAFNWRLWTRSLGSESRLAEAGQFAVPPTATPKAPRERGAQGLYDIVVNPALKGRLGRILIVYPGDTKVESRTEISKAGSAEHLKAVYGRVEAELPPDTYDLTICGRRITGIPVESAKDTRVRVGVLRLHASKSTRFGIFVPGSKECFHSVYGDADLGTPVGEIEIEVSGQREKVLIEAGKVTEY